jgi:hypothetical protein
MAMEAQVAYLWSPIIIGQVLIGFGWVVLLFLDCVVHGFSPPRCSPQASPFVIQSMAMTISSGHFLMCLGLNFQFIGFCLQAALTLTNLTTRSSFGPSALRAPLLHANSQTLFGHRRFVALFCLLHVTSPRLRHIFHVGSRPS